MNELKVLQHIALVSGKNDKRALLKANVQDQNLQDLLDATFNYKRRFYIKKWEEQPPVTNGRPLHTIFMGLIQLLESQQFRGDKATEAVEAFMRLCNPEQQYIYSGVIRQDLKAGFSVDSARDCGFDIPLFEVQLAKDGHECKKVLEMIKAGVKGSRKLDGYRGLTELTNSNGVMYSRNGTLFENFPGIVNELIELCAGVPHVFDGEAMSNDFALTQKSAFASKRKTVVGDMKYHIFDMIPYEEWLSGVFKTTAFQRYDNLANFFAQKVGPNSSLVQVEHIPITSLDHIYQLEAQYIAEGYEGVMVNPDIPYYKGKSSNKMLKFKTFLSMDCEIVSAYKGDQLSKYKDTLGGFFVKQENGVLCKVGGGYEDSERDEMWANQKDLIGRVMEVKYQNLTEDDKVMRFPVFCRWRDRGDGRGKM